VSVWETILDQHCNPELPHAVMQLSPRLPSFHSLTPAKVHVCSVESLTKPVKGVNPEGIFADTTPYLPAPHDKHVADVVAATVKEYLPEMHKVHNPVPDVPDVVLYVPAGQSMHPVFNGVVPDLPIGHEKMQGLDPFTFLNVSVGHPAHGPPSGPVFPALQIQDVFSIAAFKILPEFRGHILQLREPIVLLYRPATHAVHVPPLGPVYPMLQKQLAAEVCPVREWFEFNGQATQLAVLVVDLYVLGGQLVHVVVILVTLHVILKP
jgi:hypothetical protein